MMMDASALPPPALQTDARPLRTRVRTCAFAALLATIMAASGYGAVAPDSTPMHPYALGNQIYFSADDGIHGRELWRCEQAGDCEMAADLLPGPEGAEPFEFVGVGQYLYFRTASPTYGRHVCFLDTASGIVVNITQGVPELAAKTPLYMHASRGDVLFVMGGDDTAWEVWATQAGSERCVPIDTLAVSDTENFSRYLFALKSVGSRLLCLENDRLAVYEDMRTSRKDIAVPEGCAPQRIMDHVFDKSVIVLMSHHALGVEPYRVDLETREVALLRDIFPGPVSCEVAQETSHNGQLYFAAEDGVHGRELWRTNGTPEGTTLVMDIAPGMDSSNPYNLCSAGGQLYFVADDGIHGKELWRVDEIHGGVRMMRDMTPGPAGTEVWSLAAFQDKLFFCAETPAHGAELFMTGGATEEVHIRKDIVPGPGGSGAHNLRVFGDRLFFTCDDGIHGVEPWISDGTEAGTHLATDIAVARLSVASNPEQCTALKDRLVFVSTNVDIGAEPWVSDGTAEGTRPLCDIYPGPKSSRPTALTRHGDSVFFIAESPGHGRQLWRTDATPESTRLVEEFAPEQGVAATRLLRAIGDCLYFTAGDGVHDHALWRLCHNQAPERLSAIEGPNVIQDVFSLWGELYMYRDESDGAPLLHRLCEEKDAIKTVTAFTANANVEDILGPLAESLSDEHCRDVLARLVHPPNLMEPSYAVTPAGVAYFSTHTAAHGVELWQSDGTPAGTRLIRDIYPGPASSGPDQFTAYKDQVYFIADTPADGRVLFVTDGIRESTAAVGANHRDFTWPPLPTERVISLDAGLLLVCVLPARGIWYGPYLTLITDDGDAHYCAPIMQLSANRRQWPRILVSAGDRVFFTYQDDEQEVSLWVSDATMAGTSKISEALGPE